MAGARIKVIRSAKIETKNHTSPRHEGRPRRLTSPKRISSFKENRERGEIGEDATQCVLPRRTKKSR